MQRLTDSIAIVTGAARGIGLAIARGLAQEGALPIIFDIRREDVDAAVATLAAEGLKAEGMAVNVTDADMVAAAVKDIIARHQRIDILVNNAGVTRDGLLLKMKESDWDMVLDVNLKGAFLCTQKTLRPMLKQRSGAIINIASVIGVMGNAGQANYAASKGGLIALTKSAAREAAGRGVRVNAIAPGFIETEMTASLPQKVVENYAAGIPLGRMGKPSDVASLVVFLASNEANYITGQTLHCDGGLIM
ncbi:MAG: 3-oxoacyl-[acyl-carrier-protein] reductase [Candidatus Cloacimonetes bacterium]|nr:3-oxoacyl-[acyl-carrier-protein] reductase [Candidatus Cloacimonadota bacterium]